jgi:ubiquinone/menaquinone biosynthesis C-methylase UbiE
MENAVIQDPFQIDELRAALARKQDLPALRATYEKGAYPEPEDLSSAPLWDELAECAEVPDFRVRRLKAVAKRIPPGSHTLDIGVGWGEIIPMILAREGCRYTGIDFSEKIVARASSRHPACQFHVGGLEQIRDVYDVVLALEVCEHILPSRIFAFFEQVKRMLANEGLFIVTVPVYENLKAMTLRCPHCGHLHNRMGHVRAYTPELIKAELQLAGFEIRDSFFIYANFENSVAGWIKRRLVDLGRAILHIGKTTPLNIVVVAGRRNHC